MRNSIVNEARRTRNPTLMPIPIAAHSPTVFPEDLVTTSVEQLEETYPG